MKILFLSLMLSAYFTPYAQDGNPTPQQLRNMIEGQIKGFNIRPEPVFKLIERSVWTGTDSIKIRIYYPNASSANRAIFNIHGGALVAGNLESHDNISRTLCSRTKSVVIALDYRRPPEHPYPAGLNDTWLIMKWIITHAHEIGINKKAVSIVSDSGGSLFAAALPSKISAEKFDLTFQSMVFINPAVDLRIDSASPPNPMYRLVTGWYLNKKSADDPMVSPLLSDQSARFPGTLIVTCEKDELKSQGDRLAAKLKSGGSKTELLNIANEDHYGGYWAAAHPRAKPAIEATVDFLSRLK
jgi:acetyl esterase